MKNLYLIFALALLVACQPSKKTKSTDKKDYSAIDIEGHRGCRGLMPENTIPAFKRAIDLGVNTLELDAVITKDSMVLVSHEPWFNYHTCLDSLGNPIEAKDSMRYNIFQHTYAETQKYDCGSLGNPRFLLQQKQKVTKPLLKDVLAFCEMYADSCGKTMNYNIEIKSDPRGDNLFHPVPEVFTKLVTSVIDSVIPKDRVVLQSFDFRILQLLHTEYPDYTLSALVEEGLASYNLDKLGFIPDIYSPWYVLLQSEDVEFMHGKNIKVVPWTVNDTTEIQKLLSYSVDGIITDYPDMAIDYIR